MPEVVCFIGVIGSGKDYQSKKLIEQGYIQINFADALRQMAWDILGWKPNSEQEYEEFKKSNLTQFITGREFLQKLGSTMLKVNKNFLADRWFDLVFKELENNKNVCCSDLRYINEIETALDIQQEIINNDIPIVKLQFCNYISERYNATDTHESERLAQDILKLGFEDSKILTADDIKLIKGFKH